MSEFECDNGHLVPPSGRTCPICGGRVVRMDGMSARELAALEKEFVKVKAVAEIIEKCMDTDLEAEFDTPEDVAREILKLFPEYEPVNLKSR